MIVASDRCLLAQPITGRDALARHVPPSATARRVGLEAQVADLAPEILAAARFLTRSDEDARDVAQATIELGLRHLRSLRDPTKLRAWLFAIEAREASRWRRRLSNVLSLDHAVTEIGYTDFDPRSIALRVAVARLPRREREAVVLRYFGSLSVEETARAMGVAENTVKTHLRLALRALREALNE